MAQVLCLLPCGGVSRPFAVVDERITGANTCLSRGRPRYQSTSVCYCVAFPSAETNLSWPLLSSGG